MAIIEWPAPQKKNSTTTVVFSSDYDEGGAAVKIELDGNDWARIVQSEEYTDFWMNSASESLPSTCERHVRPGGTFYCIIGFETQESATMFKLRFM